MESTAKTQCARIRCYITENGCITALEALSELGIFRLASRICDLKKAGFDIKSRWKEVTNRYGEKCRIKEYFFEDSI